MDINEVKRIIDEYLNEREIDLKARLLNLDGYKPVTAFEQQAAKLAELEKQLEELQASTEIDDLKAKVAELDKANIDLADKIDEATNRYNDANEKLDRYRTETKQNLQEIEELRETIEERDRTIETLEAKLKETEEHFRAAAAEALKYRTQAESEFPKSKKSAKKN